MTRFEVAELLERYASKVTKIPGVSRLNPHAFAEAKSELAGEMVAEAKSLRTQPRMAPDHDAIRPGIRVIGLRKVVVERRRA